MTDLELRLTSEEFRLAEARAEVTRFLEHHAPWADRWAVILVVSELLTNARRHAGGWWSLRLVLTGATLCAEVSDRSPALPVRRNGDSLNGDGGLGLHLADDLTAGFETLLHHDRQGKTLRATWRRHDTC